MLRRIIEIDSARCNGCSLCVSACHEGAIGMVDGKAVLLRDDYCDGLGDCLPACPTGAIRFVEREALPYNEEEVTKNMEQQKHQHGHAHKHEPLSSGFGCPGSRARTIGAGDGGNKPKQQAAVSEAVAASSQLKQWPVQIKLVPVGAPYFDNANLLIAADCAAYAYGDFHNTFMRNRVTLIGCPKLDEGNYADKLTSILATNNIKSVTVVRMEVPCCGGIENAVVAALKNCGKMIPWQVRTLSIDGQEID